VYPSQSVPKGRAGKTQGISVGYPAGRLFVGGAEKGVKRAEVVMIDITYLNARDDKPATYCRDKVRQAQVHVRVRRTVTVTETDMAQGVAICAGALGRIVVELRVILSSYERRSGRGSLQLNTRRRG
jgi:hypothetical protein